MARHITGQPLNVTAPILGRIEAHGGTDDGQCSYLTVHEAPPDSNCPSKPIGLICSIENRNHIPDELTHLPIVLADAGLEPHDIVLFNSGGNLWVLYSSESPHNHLFVTNQCNCRCLICSQPPTADDDIQYWWEINARLLNLVPRDASFLGITGGEPCMLGSRLYSLLRELKNQLPNTHVHVLTNARAFSRPENVAGIASVAHPRLTFGVPLHSDYSAMHDYISQARGAYSQAIKGIYNLARWDQGIEIRIVLHKLVVPRLTKLAKFIYLNMPFAINVAFMGLENTGRAELNEGLLWIDPSEYMDELNESVEYLVQNGLNVSLYNMQLCVLPPELWKHNRRAISEWKQTYIEECRLCMQREACGGLFSTGDLRQSRAIKALTY
jgi:His-Xaa-Ser system radical SAM maturase HxsC